MRILRVADVAHVRTGGMQRAMFGTGELMQGAGHAVDYLFRDAFTVPGSERVRRFTVPFMVPRVVRQLARQGRNYDVLEVHEPSAAVCCAMRVAGRRLPPVVVYSHGLEERMHRAMLDYRKQKGLPISPKMRWSPLSVVLQARYAVRHADHVMCLNAEDFDHLRRAGVAQAGMTQAPSGISTPYLAAEPDWSRDPGSILFVGTWLLRKGIADLVPAATAVLSKEPRARLTIAGCGVPSEHVMAEFPASVRPRVAVIPLLSSDSALIDCYRRHAVFVLPSVFEGFPLVLLEAASMGLALVATDVCAMKDFVETGTNGIKVAVGAPEALADAMARLVSRPAETRRLGEAAREKARAYPWSRAAELFLDGYQHAIVHGRSR